jgi:hypothetical protein
MGCGSEEPEFTVVFEETYGECERDCHGSLRVSADGKATASLADSANSAARTRSSGSTHCSTRTNPELPGRVRGWPRWSP